MPTIATLHVVSPHLKPHLQCYKGIYQERINDKRDRIHYRGLSFRYSEDGFVEDENACKVMHIYLGSISEQNQPIGSRSSWNFRFLAYKSCTCIQYCYNDRSTKPIQQSSHGISEDNLGHFPLDHKSPDKFLDITNGEWHLKTLPEFQEKWSASKGTPKLSRSYHQEFLFH